MALEDYRSDMERCGRCSYCKWMPLAQIKSVRFAQVCPSISAGNFHSYSAGGRFVAGLSLMDGRIEYSDRLLEIVYKCQVCGACDVSCKVCRDLEPLEVNLELRARCVEDGQFLPEHSVMIESLRKEDNPLEKLKADRGKWADGFDVKDLNKEKAEVLFHAGCRYSYDEDLMPTARDALSLLKEAGVDVGIMGGEEVCCGGRAYEMGYQGELTKYAEHNIDMWNGLGVKEVVTPCGDCYGAFKFHYPRLEREMNFEVYHITEYLDRLIKGGKLKLKKKVSTKVTYHDPCHLGRLGEAFTPWKGVQKKVRGQIVVHEPRKVFKRGGRGVFEAPREVIRSIPGLELAEMERIKEYAWCCGAGGGVKEAYPEFALWTANERIEEAKATTGAEVLVTACPWCMRNFKDAIKESGDRIEVMDIIELVKQAI